MKLKVFAWVVGILLLTAFIVKNSVFRPAENFHVVDAGKFYRMAQPTAGEIKDLKEKYGIKTVINLRGKQVGEWWYDNEFAETQRLGIKQVDIPFSSDTMQFAKDWKTYLETLETAERPILVHCRSGADRTSEASAVYAIEYMKMPKEKAIEEQMSLSDLHVPFFQPAKTTFVKAYKGSEWLKNVYHPCAEEFRAYAADRCTPSILSKWRQSQAVTSSP
jgi:protein tyrosine/serine phosphatase